MDKSFDGDVEKQSIDARVSDASSDTFEKLVEAERDHDIKFRTLSWKKTAALLFAEYVCLAILALSWSFSVLGWAGGLLVLWVTGALTYYTSYTLWQYCMKFPHLTNVVEIGQHLFGGSPIARELTALGLLLNNILLMGFHVFTGSKILNTLSEHSQNTVVFMVIATIIQVIMSLPRTLKHVSYMSIASAIAMAIALLLTLIFAGAEDAPSYGYNGVYPAAGEVATTAAAPTGTTFVNGLNAALNITFLWIGQILYPSFIAEMERPQDFPKALNALTIAQFILFTVCAVVGYYYTGQYATAPLIGSLASVDHRKAAFAFVIVPTFVISVLYSNVAAKYVFNRALGRTRHVHSNTVLGWGAWIGIVIFIWILAFIFANSIPSMGDFLSLMGSLFDSFFGFIFWTIAYWHLNRGKLFHTPRKAFLTLFNVLLFGIGLFLLGPGLYTSIEAIKLDYSGTVKKPFADVDNSL